MNDRGEYAESSLGIDLQTGVYLAVAEADGDAARGVHYRARFVVRP